MDFTYIRLWSEEAWRAVATRWTLWPIAWQLRSGASRQGVETRQKHLVTFWWLVVWKMFYNCYCWLICIYTLVGGLEHVLWIPFHMGCHPSHWRTHIFQDGEKTTNQFFYVFFREKKSWFIFPFITADGHNCMIVREMASNLLAWRYHRVLYKIYIYIYIYSSIYICVLSDIHIWYICS